MERAIKKIYFVDEKKEWLKLTPPDPRISTPGWKSVKV